MFKLLIIKLVLSFYVSAFDIAPFVAQGVPRIALERARDFFIENLNEFENHERIMVIDYSLKSTKKRFFLINLKTIDVLAFQVSHGSGLFGGVAYGDPDHDGYLDKCVHSEAYWHERLNMTRPGAFKTYGSYRSTQKWPELGVGHNAIRLKGLQDTSEDALRNGVVMHEANYNVPGRKLGRSFGCPAFVQGDLARIFSRVKSGTMLYAYTPQCR